MRQPSPSLGSAPRFSKQDTATSRCTYRCWLSLFCILGLLICIPAQAWDAIERVPESYLSLWGMTIGLLLLSAAIGVVAAMVGIGGGVLYVPLSTLLFPSLHLDYIRGAGLFIGLASVLSALPSSLAGNLVQLRLSLPLALIGSIGSIAGSQVGLGIDSHWVQLGLGGWICIMLVWMAWPTAKRTQQAALESPQLNALGWTKRGFDEESKRFVWHQPQNFTAGMGLFFCSGFLGGFFGIGAGFINVPVLHVLMGLPLKWAVASSYFLLISTTTAAALIYLAHSAVSTWVTIPSVIGIMLGASLGSRFLKRTANRHVHRAIVAVLGFAAIITLLRGINTYLQSSYPVLQ